MFVYIHRDGVIKNAENSLIYRHCVVNNIPVRYFQINDEVSFTDCLMVVGSVEAIQYSAKMIGFILPDPNYYPDYLAPYINRNITEGTIPDITRSLLCGIPLFAKSYNWKLITGQVFDHENGSSILDQFPLDTKMYLSDIVTFTSEYRVYVTDGIIQCWCGYDGDEDILPDENVIESISQLIISKGQLSTFTFDVGILDTGETVLVEMNDAWAIGAYKGISASQYFNMLKSRWDQLVSNVI